MRISWFGEMAYSVAATHPPRLEEVVADVRQARDDGLHTYWVGEQYDWDILSLIGVLAREVEGIRFGSAVNHIWSRSPWHLAQQTMTTDLLTEGRFTLGLGAGHDWVVRDMWGMSFDRPLQRTAEYLSIVSSLLRKGRVDLDGEIYSVHTFFGRFQPVAELPILLGALGPKMLDLAGSEADGTITWMAGVRTIRDHITPTIERAANRAERDPPQIVAPLPISVTKRPDEVRSLITQGFDIYHHMTSYASMLRHEGATVAGDIALVGSPAQVEQLLADVKAAGVTELAAIVYGDPDERAATRDLLRTMARTGAA